MRNVKKCQQAVTNREYKIALKNYKVYCPLVIKGVVALMLTVVLAVIPTEELKTGRNIDSINGTKRIERNHHHHHMVIHQQLLIFP